MPRRPARSKAQPILPDTEDFARFETHARELRVVSNHLIDFAQEGDILKIAIAATAAEALVNVIKARLERFRP